MFQIRYASERGISRFSGITSHHSFTFNRYYNQKYLGWSDLRVLNEDFVSPQTGFDTHAHANQDILTIILSGTLEHQDSAGNIQTLRKDQIQLMNAGTGITHSEKNPSLDTDLHFLQIWIFPEIQNITPAYYTSSLDRLNIHNDFKIIAEQTPSDNNILPLNQDATISMGYFDAEQNVNMPNNDRYYWVHIVSGQVTLGDISLSAGDALHYYQQDIEFKITENNTQILLFDLRPPK
jgi:quercetin 2,3-dioxygenase